MGKQPIFSVDVRDELIDCLEKSVAVKNYWLRDAILATPGLSSEDVSAMGREDLVGEAVDLIEENFDGEHFSIDAGGMFLVDLDKLRMERELVEQISDVKQHNDLIVLAVIAGENGSVTESISHLRGQEDPTTGLLSNPFSTPKGASVTINAKGVDISNANGIHLDELKDGFKQIGEELPVLRAKALKAALKLDINKGQDQTSGMSFG